jgi:hypothetical protein
MAVTASWQVGNETGMVGNDGFMVARCHFHFLAEFSLLTLSPPLNEAKIGGFGGLQFSEKGDEGIAASPRINHFVQNFAENTMVKSAIF